MLSLTENVEKTTVCKLELDEPKAMQFKQAIENSYWFELFMGMHCYCHKVQKTDTFHICFF